MVKQIPTKNLFNKIFSREDILLVLSDEVNSSKLNILEQVAKG